MFGNLKVDWRLTSGTKCQVILSFHFFYQNLVTKNQVQALRRRTRVSHRHMTSSMVKSELSSLDRRFGSTWYRVTPYTSSTNRKESQTNESILSPTKHRNNISDTLLGNSMNCTESGSRKGWRGSTSEVISFVIVMTVSRDPCEGKRTDTYNMVGVSSRRKENTIWMSHVQTSSKGTREILNRTGELRILLILDTTTSIMYDGT